MNDDRYDFEQVRAAELEVIQRARGPAADPAAPEPDDLMGLALSGGGIRSATFNLGVLQALSRAGLLKKIDYLSTVSGGGYIGSWLSAWIARNEGGVGAVEQELGESARVDGREPVAVSWLRRYSNYLTARLGLFSEDTLTGAATYLRNVILNQLELVALLAAVLLLPLLLAWVLANGHLPWLWIGTGSLAFSIFFVNLNLHHRDANRGALPLFYQKRTGILLLVVVPLIIGGGALGYAAAETQPGYADFLGLHAWKAVAITLALYVLAWFVHKVRLDGSVKEARSEVMGAVRDFMNSDKANKPERPREYTYNKWDVARIVLGLAIAVWVGLSGIWIFNLLLPVTVPNAAGILHGTVFSVPAALMAVGMATILFLGIIGRTYSEETREWWSRLGGWILGLLLAWLAVVATTIYGPYLVMRLHGWMDDAGFAWLLTTLAGVLAGRSRFSSAQPEAGSAGQPSKRWVDWIAKFAPYVFIAGLLLGVATLLHVVLLEFAGAPEVAPGSGVAAVTFGTYAMDMTILLAPENGGRLLIVLAVLLGVVALLAATVDVNVFSFHMFYRNRLVRCYLGASNESATSRRAHPFTGFDPADSPPMTELAAQRPYHLINTALNLTRASNLAWQERKAASFLISPLFCGYDLDPGTRTGQGRYQTTDTYLLDTNSREKSGGWIPLGTALTISGAAASPNMGYHTSSATALMMAVFNVRLGWWMQNTRSRRDWSRKGPRLGALWMLYELFALADEARRFVYLSDGGHFENLGIYELVRRRCRFIIAVDASCDPGFKFEDLGNAVRKCQVDLGVRIDIDPRAIIPAAKGGKSLFHCAVGEIRYPAGTGERQTGLLLYIKPSLTGNEPADVAQYAAAHPDFPHQSTADQWFDESQFESYRRLGQHVVSTVLASVGGSSDAEWIFQNLKERWYRPARAATGAFARHADQLKAIEAALRDDPKLDFMDAQLIPEWSRLRAGASPPAGVQLGLPADGARRRAGFYLCVSMLQLMENVYLDLNLEEEWDHPDNRGWINVFKHWSWSGMFMATYSICCGMAGARFQRWCERHLDLWPGKVRTEIRVVPNDAARIVPWLRELEKKDEINFVEQQMLEESDDKGGLLFLQPGDTLVLLRMECRPAMSAPAHRGGGDELLSFTFGVAVVAQCVDEGEKSRPNALVFFRIQDHLRRMGLARRAMRELVHSSQVRTESVCWMSGKPGRAEVARIFASVKRELSDLRDT